MLSGMEKRRVLYEEIYRWKHGKYPSRLHMWMLRFCQSILDNFIEILLTVDLILLLILLIINILE